MLPDGSAGHPHRPEDQRVGDEDEEAGEKVAEDEEGEDVERGLPAGGFPGDAAGCPVGLGAVAAPLGQGGRGEQQSIHPDAQQQHSGVAGRELVACSGGTGVKMGSRGREGAERGAVTPNCPQLQRWGQGQPRWDTAGAARAGQELLCTAWQRCSHGVGRAMTTLPSLPGCAGILLSPWVGGQGKEPREREGFAPTHAGSRRISFSQLQEELVGGRVAAGGMGDTAPTAPRGYSSTHRPLGSQGRRREGGRE